MPSNIPNAPQNMDPDDPYAREAQTFPHLTEEMIRRVASYGHEEELTEGTMLFERGQRNVDFFVVLDGTIEIFEVDVSGEPHVLVAHTAGEFTGELDLFTERQVLVSARATSPVRVLRLNSAEFHRMSTAETDIGEIVMRAFILRRVGLIRHAQGGVVIVGSRRDGDTLRVERFLTRNAYPHRLLDVDGDADAGSFLQCFNISRDRLPVVITPDKRILRNPSNGTLADGLGLMERVDSSIVYDVAVVGAGPAGLAAAVYAASEGLHTVVIEGLAPGGQAGTSSKIENYLGFPTGISGQALAGRAQVQAQKFGARLLVSRMATGIQCEGNPHRVLLDDGQFVQARVVVIASGARYRRLDVPNFEKFEGQGIHYAATAMEAQLCTSGDVIVVGGGNSAGQAAIFLARSAAHVHLLVRGPALAATMSDYLVQRIESSPKITLHTRSEIVGLEGDRFLKQVTWRNRDTGAMETHEIANLFLMIGAEPNTGWLENCVALDAKGFVQTGWDANGQALQSPYATTRPGIYAVGDVRSGSVKRVASGVGEGSVVIQAVHQYLNPGVA